MSERAESTLGYERRTNHLFSLTEEAFVAEILASVPPVPTYYPRMKELNARGADAFDAIPGATALSPTEVEALMAEKDVMVLDLRRLEAFGDAHIRGSINIGAGQNLSLWAGWLLNSKHRIVLVGEQGDDEESRRGLVRVGLDNITGFLKAGMSAWINAGLAFERTTQLSTEEVRDRSKDTLVLDVRSEAEWRTGHIEGATHIMLGDLPHQAQKLPKDRPIVCVCGSVYRSTIAAGGLAKNGFSSVESMDGGMAAWNNRNSPSKNRPDREHKETANREYCREATHLSFSCADSTSVPPDRTSTNDEKRPMHS